MGIPHPTRAEGTRTAVMAATSSGSGIETPIVSVRAIWSKAIDSPSPPIQPIADAWYDRSDLPVRGPDAADHLHARGDDRKD